MSDSVSLLVDFSNGVAKTFSHVAVLAARR